MIWLYALIWFVVYSLVAYYVSKNYDLENINITGPILSIRSKFGLNLIKYLSKKFNRFWNIWGYLGVLAGIITGILSIFVVGLSVWAVVVSGGDVGIQGPTDMLVIPGVNRFLPLSATPEIVAGLLIGMVVHEAGHAIYCRTGDIKINSTGLIFAGLIPLGAFVEPDEDEQDDADPLPSLKMFSAGIMNNYAVFIITIILFVFTVSTFIAPISGYSVGQVIDNSPAEEVGIEKGDIITNANGYSIEQNSDLVNLTSSGLENVTVNGDKIELPDKVYITESPEQLDVLVGKNIVSVDGENISNTKEFENEIQNIEDRTANVQLDSGKSIKIEIGAYTTVYENGSISDAMDVDNGKSTFIFTIDGERVYNDSDISEELSSKSSGDNISISYGVENDIKTNNYTIQDINRTTGVASSSQLSGVSASDLGVYSYPSKTFYDIVTFKQADSVKSVLSHVYTVMILPLGSLIPGVEFDLPGFTPFVQNFYTTTVSDGLHSSAVFTFSSVLLWTSWINFNLAIFNCMPTFLLDGGHILESLTKIVLPDHISDKNKKYIRWIFASIILTLLLSLMFLPLIL